MGKWNLDLDDLVLERGRHKSRGPEERPGRLHDLPHGCQYVSLRSYPHRGGITRCIRKYSKFANRDNGERYHRIIGALTPTSIAHRLSAGVASVCAGQYPNTKCVLWFRMVSCKNFEVHFGCNTARVSGVRYPRQLRVKTALHSQIRGESTIVAVLSKAGGLLLPGLGRSDVPIGIHPGAPSIRCLMPSLVLFILRSRPTCLRGRGH